MSVTLANLVAAAASNEKSTQNQENGAIPGMAGWHTVRTATKLRGGKIPGFLRTNINHIARHKQQVSVRLAAETERARLVMAATRKFKGQTTTDLFKAEIDAKQDLVDEKINKLPFHEKVQKQYTENTPNFMKLTENQADRASDIIRKRDDWEVRRKAKAQKEVRATTGFTNTDLYNAHSTEAVRKKVEKSMLDTYRPKATKISSQVGSGRSSSKPQPPNTPKHVPRYDASLASSYSASFMRPTHSSQSHVRPKNSLEYTAEWRDRQYLTYDHHVNRKNVSPRAYLAPQPAGRIVPQGLSTTRLRPSELDGLIPQLQSHLSPIVLHNSKRRQRHPRAMTSRPGPRHPRHVRTHPSQGLSCYVPAPPAPISTSPRAEAPAAG